MTVNKGASNPCAYERPTTNKQKAKNTAKHVATWDGDACQLEESEAGRGDRKRPRGVKGPPPTQGGAEARSQGCGEPSALRGGNSPGGGRSLQRLGQNERGTDGQKPLGRVGRTWTTLLGPRRSS